MAIVMTSARTKIIRSNITANESRLMLDLGDDTGIEFAADRDGEAELDALHDAVILLQSEMRARLAKKAQGGAP